MALQGRTDTLVEIAAVCGLCPPALKSRTIAAVRLVEADGRRLAPIQDVVTLGRLRNGTGINMVGSVLTLTPQWGDERIGYTSGKRTITPWRPFFKQAEMLRAKCKRGHRVSITIEELERQALNPTVHEIRLSAA